MTTVTTGVDPIAADQAGVGTASAFRALLARDFYVLTRNLKEFIPRTVLQPLLLVFVFTYVFPKIGQGIGGEAGAAQFSTMLVAGVLASVIMFQGIQAVALPMVQEFGYTKEIEDRVLAPLPTKAVGIQKIVTGLLNSLFAALLVFPIAYIVPATTVHLHIHWLTLITLALLAGWVAAALGLVLGTKVAPQQVSYLFALVVLPITFLGCIYYPWRALEAVRWLQIVVLINPLVYMCEGFRAALTTGTPHMSLWAVYGGLSLFAIVLTWVGIDGFERRTVA